MTDDKSVATNLSGVLLKILDFSYNIVQERVIRRSKRWWSFCISVIALLKDALSGAPKDDEDYRFELQHCTRTCYQALQELMKILYFSYNIIERRIVRCSKRWWRLSIWVITLYKNALSINQSINRFIGPIAVCRQTECETDRIVSCIGVGFC